VHGELLVAEVRVLRAGRHDQRVVRHRPVAPVGGVDQHRLPGHVDVGDPAEPHVDVAAALEDLADRRRHLALAQDPGGHLVQQRLEQVVRGAADERHISFCPSKGLGGEQPTEARPDNDNAMRIHA
jgi:hypothetical protein